MTDVDATSSGDAFSKEYVDKLKAEAAAKDEEMAKLRAFKAGHDEQQRKLVTAMQPDVLEFMGVLNEKFPDHVAQMEGINTWGKSAHESNSLDTAVSLSRTISCASALYKRSREEASQLQEKAGTLGETMKKVEELEASDAKKAQRITELEALCNERQASNEAMQEALAKAGIIKDKMDFSKTACEGHCALRRHGRHRRLHHQERGRAARDHQRAAGRRHARAAGDHPQASPRRGRADVDVTGKASGLGSHRSTSRAPRTRLSATAGRVDDEIASAIGGSTSRHHPQTAAAAPMMMMATLGPSEARGASGGIRGRASIGGVTS